MFGNCNAGVITGLNNNATQQILNTDLGIHVDKHFGAFHTPGFFTDVDLVSQFKIAINNLFDGNVGSHNFGQAGRRQGLIRILFYQNLTSLRVQQHIAGGGDIRCARNDDLRHRDRRRHNQDNTAE